MKFCRLLCIIASIEYIRRQIEESFTSCIKGLIRKFTEIHILTIQSGVNKRNKNRGEHSVIKHQFSIHSYIPVIKKYHDNQMQVVYDQTYSTFPFKASREPHKCVEKVLFMCRNGHFVFSNFLPVKGVQDWSFVQIYAHWVKEWSPISNACEQIKYQRNRCENNNQTLEYHCSNPSKGMKSMQSLYRLHICNFSFFYFTGTNAITVTMKANKSKESSTTAAVVIQMKF